MPLISVLMPVYNMEKYIKYAIESILYQTINDFEFIIIDDGSTDQTYQIIQSYRDFRIKIHRNNTNVGIAKSLNTGIELSRGKYIARIDGDDMCSPQRFKKQIDYLESNKDVSLVGTFRINMDKNNRLIDKKYYLTDYNDIKNFNTKMCIELCHPSIMARSEVFKKYRYNEKYEAAEDYELFSRLCEKYKVKNIPEFLTYYRLHEDSVSTSQDKKQKEIAIRVIKDILARRKINTENLNRLSNSWENITFLLNYMHLLHDKNIVIMETKENSKVLSSLLQKIKCNIVSYLNPEYIDLYKLIFLKFDYIILINNSWYETKELLLQAGIPERLILYGYFCKKELEPPKNH